MNTFHVLNGDSLVEKFSAMLEGQVIVFREALIEGPVAVDCNKAFWMQRAYYITHNYGMPLEEYEALFLSQIDHLESIKTGDKVFLWFEDDLFCQVNMWFVVHHLIRHSTPHLYRVFPTSDIDLWMGFALAKKEDLKALYHQSVRFETTDIILADNLWKAYVTEDQTEMQRLSSTGTSVMRYLPEVIAAHLARLHQDESERQPQKLLREIMHRGRHSFEDIFHEFTIKAAIYGYGDLQIKNILKEMKG